MSERIFGEIEGYPSGTNFVNRISLSQAGVHKPPQSGISGSQVEGADSIVLSGGYEDDEDHGDQIIYTGHGGRERNSTKHTFDQEFNRGNKALALNKDLGLPVRVIRGYTHDSPHSPENGYRYDGLFRVENYWSENGAHGFKVYRYYLSKINEDSPENINETIVFPNGQRKRRRVQTQVIRIVRDTALSRLIKRNYNFKCQVCGLAISKRTGLYAEGAHIKPIGEPHNGPDISENILCLCPNHHVMFDGGAFGINDDLSLIGLDGELTVSDNHDIGSEYIQYHREIHEL